MLHMVGRVALERQDVQRVVDDAAAAVHLAGVLAYAPADDGQRVVLADEPDRIGVAAGLDERDVPGDVDVGRAAGDARDALVLREAAGMLAHVVLEVVAEPAHGHERQRDDREGDHPERERPGKKLPLKRGGPRGLTH